MLSALVTEPACANPECFGAKALLRGGQALQKAGGQAPEFDRLELVPLVCFE